MLDRTNLIALMKQVAKADPSAPVSYRVRESNMFTMKKLALMSSRILVANLFMMK